MKSRIAIDIATKRMSKTRSPWGVMTASLEHRRIFANQLGADLQAYAPYAAVPVGGEEEVHGRLQMKGPPPE
jgi:hypothetical protein